MKKIIIRKGTIVGLHKVTANLWERNTKYVLTLKNIPQNQLVKSTPVSLSWADEATIQDILSIIAEHNSEK